MVNYELRITNCELRNDCLVLTTVDTKIVARYVEGKDKGDETGGSDVLPL